jgi:hypothetical protein
MYLHLIGSGGRLTVVNAHALAELTRHDPALPDVTHRRPAAAGGVGAECGVYAAGEEVVQSVSPRVSTLPPRLLTMEANNVVRRRSSSSHGGGLRPYFPSHSAVAWYIISGCRCRKAGRVAVARESRGLCFFYGLIAATRRVAAMGLPYQKRAPSDRRSVIFSPRASSSLA